MSDILEKIDGYLEEGCGGGKKKKKKVVKEDENMYEDIGGLVKKVAGETEGLASKFKAAREKAVKMAAARDRAAKIRAAAEKGRMFAAATK
jgi:hypothetical protein